MSRAQFRVHRLPHVLRCTLAAALVAGSVSACRPFDGMRFVADRRLSIVAPRSGETIELPYTMRWRSTLQAGQRLAVIVGNDPPAPGRALTERVDSGDPCHVDRSCARPDIIASYGMFIGDGASVTVTSSPAPQAGNTVTATVFLLDDSGRRLGESAWYVKFQLSRQS